VILENIDIDIDIDKASGHHSISEEDGVLGGVLVPLGTKAEVLGHILVPDEEMFVAPSAWDNLAGEHQVSNPLLLAS